jgi:hypothetical protein
LALALLDIALAESSDTEELNELREELAKRKNEPKTLRALASTKKTMRTEP